MAGPEQPGSAAWEHVGRRLLSAEFAEQRQALSAAFHEAEDVLGVSGDARDLDAEDVLELRRRLNRARWVVEEYAAVATPGVDPWGEPVPQRPYGEYERILGP